MLSRIESAWRRLCRDESGNIFILFGASAIPLMLLAGGAVDIARYSRYKMELSNAVDAASLALAKKGVNYTEEVAEQYVKDYVAALGVPVAPADDPDDSSDDAAITAALSQQFVVTDVAVTKRTNGFLVDADANMKTIFLPLGGLMHGDQGNAAMRTMGMDVTAEVVHSSNRVELALVIDNTGSMNCGATLGITCAQNWSNPAADSRIKAVKVAAKSLVDTLMRDDLADADQIKIALVPFEGMVNIASAIPDVTAPPSWVAWADQGTATWDGANFEKKKCNNTTGTVRPGHGCLFKALTSKDSTVKWAGCVEMRAGTYELSDTAPGAAADSQFVPFFHPDEPDSATTVGSSGATRFNSDSNGSSSGGTQYVYQNDYLHDKTAFTTPAAAQKSFAKYFKTGTWPTFHSGRKDVEGLLTPYQYGPNKGCPRPIYPLANGTATNKAAIKAEIDKMIAYWSTGTFIPAGLMWGWHVLSPGIPYTQGTKPGDLYYDKTVKAIVLFTDGENDVTDDGPGSTHPNKSRYNAWSYVTTVAPGTTTTRLGSSAAAAITTLDTKTATLCTSVKTAGIRLYTITFGSLDASTITLMTNCATVDDGDALYYHAPDTAALEGIFRRIGEDLSEIHLSM